MCAFYINKSFFEEIPIERKNHIQEKLKGFSKELIEKNYIYFNMNNGWFIKNIKTEKKKLFEFRINQGERIYFKLDGENVFYICWVSESKHDFGPDYATSIYNSVILNSIEYIFTEEKKNYSLETILENELDYEKFSNSIDLLEVLDIKRNLPFIVDGVGGSGKSTLIEEILSKLNSDMNILYITSCKKSLERQKIKKIEFKEIFPFPDRVVFYEEFEEWFQKNYKNNGIAPIEVWKEIDINSKKNKLENQKIIEEFIYWCKNNQKINLFRQIEMLEKEKYIKEKYDFIICDNLEMIPESGIKLIRNMLENPNYFIGVGDKRASIDTIRSGHDELKNFSMENKINWFKFNNNYRSNKKIVEFMKKLSGEDIKCFHINESEPEIGEALCFYKEEDFFKILGEIKNCETIVVLKESSKNKLGEFKDKAIVLKETVSLEKETIICIDILGNLNENGINIWNIYSNFIYLVSSKCKKNIIFLENEQLKDKIKEVKSYNWEVLRNWIFSETNIEKEIENAKYYHEQGHYKKAGYIYKSLGMLDRYRLCLADQFYADKKYEQALEEYEALGDKEQILKCQEIIKIVKNRDTYSEEKNLKKYLEGINLKNDYGLYEIGKFYSKIGLKNDCFKIFSKLLENGATDFKGELEYHIGMAYLKAEGVKQDKKKGIEFLELSSRKYCKEAEKVLNRIKK